MNLASALKNFVGKNQNELYKSIAAGLSVASLECSWVSSKNPPVSSYLHSPVPVTMLQQPS